MGFALTDPNSSREDRDAVGVELGFAHVATQMQAYSLGMFSMFSN